MSTIRYVNVRKFIIQIPYGLKREGFNTIVIPGPITDPKEVITVGAPLQIESIHTGSIMHNAVVRCVEHCESLNKLSSIAIASHYACNTFPALSCALTQEHEGFSAHSTPLIIIGFHYFLHG